MGTENTVLVLGGGVGGVVVASELAKRLPRGNRIVLIEREREHVFAPSLPWLSVGLRRADALKRPLAKLKRRGVEVLYGELEKLDPEEKTVTVSGRELRGDILVVALGAELAPETIPGLSAGGHNLYTLAGAEALREALSGLARGRVVVLTAAPAYKCPAAPYETALLIESALRRRGLGDAVGVEVYAAEPGPMGVAGPETSAAVKQLLAGRGIPYHPEHQVLSVDAVAKTLTFTNGEVVAYDLLAYVPPHRAPRVVRESALAGETGWVPVERQTLATRFPGVFALGDVVSIPLKLGKPLPKAGVFAHREAVVVARNIVARLAGRPEEARFDGHGQCFIEAGDGKAAFGGGDFYAGPTPRVKLRAPSRRWHLAKVLLEKAWLHVTL